MHQLFSHPDFEVQILDPGENIDLSQCKDVQKLKLCTCYIRTDGSSDGKPSLCFVGTNGEQEIYMQITVHMFSPVILALLKLHENSSIW